MNSYCQACSVPGAPNSAQEHDLAQAIRQAVRLDTPEAWERVARLKDRQRNTAQMLARHRRDGHGKPAAAPAAS